MKRRDLNPGDVFIYVTEPYDRYPAGTVRCVEGAPSWFEGAQRSPDGYNGNPVIPGHILDEAVIKLTKPAGRMERRTEIKAMLRNMAAQAEGFAEELEDKASQV